LVFAVAGIWKAVFAAQAFCGLPSRWHPRDVFGFHALPRTGATLEARQQSADASAKEPVRIFVGEAVKGIVSRAPA